MKYFFSYSRNDAEFVLKLARDLKSQDLDVWLDQLDIMPGSRWDAAVEQALGEAACMLVVLSDTSVKSENVLDEVSYAIKKGKKVIPLLIDNCEVPFRIARFQQIDFTKNYSAGLELLTRTLKSNNETPHDAASQDYPAKQHDIESIREKSIDKKRSLKPILYIVSAILIVIAIWYVINNRSGKYNLSENTNTDSATTILVTDSADQSKKDENKKPDSAREEPRKPRNGGMNIDTFLNPPMKVVPVNPEILEPTTTKNPVVDDGRNKIIYRISNNYLMLYITTKQSPSIKIDINQNSMIDANYDRAYGITRNKSICVQYLIRSGTSSTCGAPPSKARLSIKGDVYAFIIPLDEIKINSASSVSVQFEFTNLSTLKRTFYPARSDYVDFTKVYKINIRRGN